ncbi:hypothetical protein ACIBQX_11260 [Nonomuraea sp. NPDC049714]|uniref:hypothetical protein n=1 Tax=Nonomuraea sp. NPDC049714 TaxID=3364357 RepID=UPI00378C33C0
MAKSGYVVTSGSVSLVASTLKYVLGVQAGTEYGVDLKKLRIGFNGVDATDAPTLVELCAVTFATNAPGTNSSPVTPRQVYGRHAATGFLAASNWTSVPTVVTVLEEFLLSPNGGLVMYDWPLGDTPDSPLGEGFAVRCTSADAVALRAAMWFERC